MSEDPYVPNAKDEVAPEPADRLRSTNRDPDGTLLAAEEGSFLAAKSHKVSTDRQAKTAESPRNKDNVRAPPSSAAEAAATLMAFDVVAVGDSTTGNNNNDIVPNIINNDSNETAAPPQINHDHSPKSFPWNTAIVAVAVVVIVIVGIVEGGVCGSGGCGGTGNGDNPSPPTTMAPTTPSPPTPSSRSQDITNFINWKSYMGFNLSPTGTSPEELALQWLIHDDPLQLNVGAESDEFRLLQRYSLLTFWFQAGTGTTWRNSTNWLKVDECTWYGITCQSGVVTVVDFWNNGHELQGTLSPDLGLLTALTKLHLAYNSVSGSLPSEIGLWTNLEGFFVYDTHLTGSLPSEIGLWTNLERFAIFWNALTGTIPATIANWKLIEDAEFSSNNFSGSMPNGICEFITGTDELWADCDEVTCSCCTCCTTCI